MLCLKATAAAAAFVCAAFAQTPPAENPPAPAANAWTIGGVNFSGLLDGYYSVNFDHPASRANSLRNFDVNANQFSLNMAKITMERTADPLGFRLDLGFGKTFEIVHASEKSPGIVRNIEQAYISYKPPAAKGLQIDFGKFVTSAGAEVIETNNNWNYSRSLLFAWALPYYHFGVRTNMPVGKHFSVGAQLVNGWNNVEDNNSGKTVGLTAAISTAKFTWSHNYYTGPEKTDLNRGRRQLYDTTLLVTPTTKASFYVNFDYGTDKNIGPGSNRWVGVAGAARFAATNWLAFSPRLEWFNDADGFSTGARQKLKEFTMTTEFKTASFLTTRLEYRRDWSNEPFFERGTGGTFKRQDTVLVGLIAYLGPESK